MYIIKKISFDNSENTVGSAVYSAIIGYGEDLNKVTKFIEEEDKKLKHYTGWNGGIYPKLEYEKLTNNIDKIEFTK
jgi:hypothetical protein